MIVLSAHPPDARSRASASRRAGARGELLANAIFHRAREVVAGPAGSRTSALREDPGLRVDPRVEHLLARTSPTPPSSTSRGVAVAASRPGSRGQPLPAARHLDELLAQSRPSASSAPSTSRAGRRSRCAKPLLLGGAAVRIDPHRRLDAADRAASSTRRSGPPLVTAVVALRRRDARRDVPRAADPAADPRDPQRAHPPRPRRVRRHARPARSRTSSASSGSFFNTAQRAAVGRSHAAAPGQKANLESVVEHLEDAVAIFNPDGELLFANPAMRATLPADAVGRAARRPAARGASVPGRSSRRRSRRGSRAGPCRRRSRPARRTARPRMTRPHGRAAGR